MANEIQFPTSPTNGNIYSMGGRNYRYDSAQDKFVAVATATIVEGGGVTIYATIDDLPLSGNTQGDLAHVTANNTLYFWNGSGWYKIALINNSPSISNVNSSYTLSDIGADTVITIVAEDPEGLAITYSIASDTSGNTATVVQGTGANTNIFTITPSTDANDNGTFSLTFRASDGVNIATAPASFTLNISTIVENSNYTTALITSVGTNNQVNNDFVDSSTNSHTITAVGNATQNTFSPHRHGGYSYYLDGSSYSTIPGNAGFAFGTGDFTIEWWYRGLSQDNKFFFDWRQAAVGSQLHITTGGYNGTLSGGVRIAGPYELVSTSVVDDGQWHHIAIVRNNSTTSIYVDGTSEASTSDTTDYSRQGLIIGTNSYDTAGPKNTGELADVRFVKGTAVYTADFTPPTERLTAITNTTLLFGHLNRIEDGSTSGHTFSHSGNVRVVASGPYEYETYSAADNGGSSYAASRSDGRLQTTTADVNFGTGDFTIEAWCYITDFSYGPYIADTRTSALSEPAIAFYFNTSAQYQVYVAGGVRITGTDAAIANQWNHCALVRSGGTTTAYLNGVSQGTWADSTNYTGSSLTTIGGRYVPYSGSYYDLTGNISNFRIVKGTAVYTSNFTPPTAPLTAITNTSLLLSGTNTGIIDKSQSVKSLTLAGDTKSSTTQTKYLSSSMYFDEAGDTLTMTSDIPFFGSGDWTFEGWFYFTSVNKSDWQYIFDGRNNGSNYFAQESNNNWRWNSGSGAAIATGLTSSTFSNNTWYHLAVARESGTLRVFVDGTYTGGGADSSAYGTTNLVIAGRYASPPNNFGMYVQDLRFTNGLARYTANFTPPTAALQG